MSSAVTRVSETTSGNGGECLGVYVWVWCPGCDDLHQVVFRCPDHGTPMTGPVWDGDPHFEPFTMSPSLLVQGASAAGPTVCHSFIREGRWEYLCDCKHALAGQTVPLPPLPDWAA